MTIWIRSIGSVVGKWVSLEGYVSTIHNLDFDRVYSILDEILQTQPDLYMILIDPNPS